MKRHVKVEVLLCASDVYFEKIVFRYKTFFSTNFLQIGRSELDSECEFSSIKYESNNWVLPYWYLNTKP